VEYDILGELEVVLDRTLARDDQHEWRTCMGEVAVASDKDPSSVVVEQEGQISL
jgi:hypothetical protein